MGIFPQNYFAYDLLPRHFVNSVQLADSASTTHLYYDYDAVRDRRGRTTQAGAADVPATLHRLMDGRGHGRHLHHYHHHTCMENTSED